MAKRKPPFDDLWERTTGNLLIPRKPNRWRYMRRKHSPGCPCCEPATCPDTPWYDPEPVDDTSTIQVTGSGFGEWDWGDCADFYEGTLALTYDESLARWVFIPAAPDDDRRVYAALICEGDDSYKGVLWQVWYTKTGLSIPCATYVEASPYDPPFDTTATFSKTLSRSQMLDDTRVCRDEFPETVTLANT